MRAGNYLEEHGFTRTETSNLYQDGKHWVLVCKVRDIAFSTQPVPTIHRLSECEAAKTFVERGEKPPQDLAHWVEAPALRWSDGRRERRAMPTSIDVSAQSRLWIHPNQATRRRVCRPAGHATRGEIGCLAAMRPNRLNCSSDCVNASRSLSTCLNVTR